MNRKEQYIVSIFEVPEPYCFFNVLTRKAEYHLAVHNHEKFHVNLITEGSVEVKTEKRTLTVRAGEAFVMPPQVEHELWSKGGYSQIGMDVNDVSDEYGLVGRLHDVCMGSAIKVKIVNPGIADYVTDKTLADMSPLSRLRCINRMSELLVDIIESACKEPAQRNFRAQFIQAATHCAQHGASLDELCGMMNFSKTHLERLTKKEFGCSAIEYTDKLRFLKICSLLTTTDKTLAAIAEECGFFDSSHLCVFFKKHSGKTPAKYRREL